MRDIVYLESYLKIQTEPRNSLCFQGFPFIVLNLKTIDHVNKYDTAVRQEAATVFWDKWLGKHLRVIYGQYFINYEIQGENNFLEMNCSQDPLFLQMGYLQYISWYCCDREPLYFVQLSCMLRYLNKNKKQINIARKSYFVISL